MVNANTRAFSSRYTLLPRATNARACTSESFGRTVSSRPPLPPPAPPYTLSRHRGRERTRFRMSRFFRRDSREEDPVAGKDYCILAAHLSPRFVCPARSRTDRSIAQSCRRTRVRPASTASQLRLTRANVNILETTFSDSFTPRNN